MSEPPSENFFFCVNLIRSNRDTKDDVGSAICGILLKPKAIRRQPKLTEEGIDIGTSALR
jgi:hypothetical protein